MRKLFILAFLFKTILSVSQNVITDKYIWSYHNGHTYDFEWTDEASEDKFFQDTFYVIQFFPKKNDWKIFFDASQTKVATIVHYDSIKKTINTKHFNSQGKLTKELHARYTNRKNYNPGFVKAKDVIYLKSFLNDSLICETFGYKTFLLIKYKNYQTKKYFEKRVFYSDNDIVGEDFWEYYYSGNIKMICSSFRESTFDAEGNQIITSIFNCKEFDKNGCIILQSK